MFLLFHGLMALEPLAYIAGFLGLVALPLAGIAFYRMYSGRLSDKTFRKSLYSIGIFTIVSVAIFASAFYFLFQWEEDFPQIYHYLYCLSVPFGLALSIVTVVKTENTLIAVIAGVFLNLSAMTGFLSLFYDRNKE